MIEVQPRRRFNVAERQAMYIASGGKCSQCGADLTAGWHADHVVAWARGGATDVLNGQALCPKCNLKKGPGVVMKPWVGEMRSWQEAALDRYRAVGQRDFLCVACPGAGKTRFALRLAHDGLLRGTVRRVVIVCPTEHLKRQWTLAAHMAGINLDPDWSGAQAVREAPDFQGVATTYMGVYHSAQFHRHLCGIPTFVIFDEVHHAGDGNGWGDALRVAFEASTARLCLSGTPFRQDNQPIPFVRYDDGRSVADYTYSFGQAQTDEVCRQVSFPTYEGDIEWIKDGKTIRAQFRDDLKFDEARQRLRAALSPDVDYLPELLRQASAHLDVIRSNGHPNAGGLVLAIDQAHAIRVAKLLYGLTGEDATVAVSDEDKATGSIKDFAAGTSKWIVAVKMVSEGVDIPRLRVLAYVTNVATEMFFRQAVGRIVRVMEGLDEQMAYLYCPADPIFIGYAREIMEEREHYIEEQSDREILEAQEEGREIGMFAPVSGTALAHDVIHKDQAFDQADINEARTYMEECGLPRSTPLASLSMAMKRYAEKHGGGVAEPRPIQPAPVPVQTATLSERKKAARRMVSKRVARLVNVSGMDPQGGYAVVYGRLMSIDGVLQKAATEEQLFARAKVLQEWIDREIRHA